MNKTQYFLDAKITMIKNTNNQQETEYNFNINPHETIPSLYWNEIPFSITLRFFGETQWSDYIFIKDVNEIKDTKLSKLLKSIILKLFKNTYIFFFFKFLYQYFNLVPRMQDDQTFNNVWCHFIFEKIEDIPHILVRLQ